MKHALAPACIALIWTTLGAAEAKLPASQVTVPAVQQQGAGQAFYFVLTDRFWNADPANDRGAFQGDEFSHGFNLADRWRFHGGDFKGLVEKLDYIKGLGVTSIWITPPFGNEPVHTTEKYSSSAYHGYWINDFLNVDSHLGTNEDFWALVQAVHAKGMKLFVDIVVNHTGDVIKYSDGNYDYVPTAEYPYTSTPGGIRVAAGEGRTVNLQTGRSDDFLWAWNGFPKYNPEPKLDAAYSFPHKPVFPAGLEHAKNPAWLNDITNYHNRGNSTFKGESSVLGDFVGLDDLFTEKRVVVEGMIDIYRHWIKEYQIDGYRIDTVRHVNRQLWQAFCPAIRDTAASEKREGFYQFGEYALGDAAIHGDFLWETGMDSTLDFPLHYMIRDWVAKGEPNERIQKLFRDDDDQFTRHDGDVRNETTFAGNHDDGRFAYFVDRENPKADSATRLRLTRLGYGLLLLSRGQPVIYYGDEQGMHAWGDDNMAREDMFAAQAPEYRSQKLLGTTLTGADDKFDTGHPLYRLSAELLALRKAEPALATGSTVLRPVSEKSVLAVSRFDRDERKELLLVFNNSRTKTVKTKIPLGTDAEGNWTRLWSSDAEAQLLPAKAGASKVTVTLPPLGFAVWKKEKPLNPAGTPALRLSLKGPKPYEQVLFRPRPSDGQTYVERQELLADVSGADGVAEVTFALERASAPGQYTLLGTDNAPPYRVFWRPPADIEPNVHFRLIATVTDLRGHQASATIDHLSVDSVHPFFGITGSKTPRFTSLPPETLKLKKGQALKIEAPANGSGTLTYRWYHNDREVPGASGSSLEISSVTANDAGAYRAVVRNLSGTTATRACTVEITD